jgi:hypothetical protein
MTQAETDPREDPSAVLAHLSQWAARFHDEESPAEVTDVLASFAFMVGLNMAVADAKFAAALLRRLDEVMPSAGAYARIMARMLAQPCARANGQRNRAGLRPHLEEHRVSDV